MLTLALVLATCLTTVAGEFTFIGKTDKDPITYKPGEEMVFSVTLYEDGKAVDGKNLVWKRQGDDGKSENGKAVSNSNEPLVLKTSIDVPGFVFFTVFVLDENGKPLPKQNNQFNGGAGVLLDQIKGFPEPADFDAFWQRQKERLAKVPVRADMTEVPSGMNNVLCYDIRVDCVGKAVSGYYCKPKNAAAKSLPASVTFHGYGVGSSNKRPNPNMITLDINAHGIDNGQPPAYYDKLKATTLRGYGLDVKGNSNPETCYWNGMMMRLMRALQFIKSQPEWDGKTLMVSGGSQGGLQCLSAAALDPDVTFCDAHVPWFGDISGKAENKRVGSVFMPQWTPSLGYYDTTNQAKRIKCKVNINAGLGDYVCPPSGQMVLYNNITSPKTLNFLQGKTHGFSGMKEASKSVLTNIK